MAQHGLNLFGSSANVDPNDLSMTGGYSPTYSHGHGGSNFNSNINNSSNGFSSGSAVFGDDELLDGLASPPDGQSGIHGHTQDFSAINMGFAQGTFPSHRASSMHVDPSHINGFSHTPDGDPIQSPYATGFNASFRQMHNNHSLGTSLHSPLSYSGSPLTGPDMATDANDGAYPSAKARTRMSQQMQRKASNTRNPMTPKTNTIHGIPIGSHDSSSFGQQPLRASASHEKSPSGQWLNTPPNGSIPASYNSGFSSPMQQGMMPLNEVMLKGGTSMPAKLGVAPNTVSTQEMKRKRRRESHNLVERRRRDNINERIQDLSKLVPTHRLEDEKVRKLINNGTPLSPTLTGMPSPTQATSGLAGPGARRAAGGSVGNITTGLPVEDKDKGPNKGDILNGAVSWTRDLMWILHLKLQQQEELMNTFGDQFPFEVTDDEKRMQSELLDAMTKSETGAFSYSRTAGSGLRVPNWTDYRGETISSTSVHNSAAMGASVNASINTLTADLDSIEFASEHNGKVGIGGDLGDEAQFWHDPDDDGSGNASLNFKEEDDYDMDLTH
ncbi:hypothetical protein CDD81_3497 [Ophiocordyceps australis]|uniref:BHLH domain-containing protein n=1 Tax=Ophiocordyceps australis TaxID=1399860 RepID=A0A2C5XW01_9HYPO|nr:hypothetical protein CDD81_3497 [Ophiocordyceps australis]